MMYEEWCATDITRDCVVLRACASSQTHLNEKEFKLCNGIVQKPSSLHYSLRRQGKIAKRCLQNRISNARPPPDFITILLKIKDNNSAELGELYQQNALQCVRLMLREPTK